MAQEEGMKRALFVALLFSTVALAAPQKKAGGPAKIPTPTGAEALAGWSDLIWGMTSAQVVAAHPDAKPLPQPDRARAARLGMNLPEPSEEAKASNAGALELQTNVLDRPFSVVLRFKGGSLNSVTLHWQAGFAAGDPNGSAGAAAGARLETDLVAALTEKYGAPAGPTAIATGATHAKTYGWKLPKTNISFYSSLYDNGTSKMARAILSYSDASGGNTKGNF
jgi:hypothetical protein